MSGKNILVNCLIVVLVAFVIGGCEAKTATTSTTLNNTHSSAASPVSVSLDSKEKGYIYQSSNEAMFITWTEDTSNKIVGQLQITYLSDSGIKSDNHAINGVINGSNMSITITGSIWNDGAAGKVFTGTLNGGSQLTLLLPASNGMMTSIPFTSGNVNEFNNIVTTLNNTYAARQNAAQEVAQQQALQKKQQEIVQNLTGSYNALQQDMSNLSSFDFSKDIESMKEHYTKMQSDYNKLQKDASVVPLTTSQLEGTVTSDLEGTLNSDLEGTLNSDLEGTINSDVSSLKLSISNIKNDIANVQTAYQKYQENNINDKTYTDDSIASIITQAQNDVKAANDKISSTQNQANAVYDEGKQLYQTAQKYVSSLTASS